VTRELARVLVLLLGAVVLSCAPAQSKAAWLAAADSLNLLCSLEKPVVIPGESVKASVLADSPASSAVEYEWTADAGAFVVFGRQPSPKVTGSDVEWSAADVSRGSHLLSVSAHDASGASGTCTLRVSVANRERGAGESNISSGALARAFLLRGAMEVPGYGLYTYVALSKLGCSAAGRERCKVFISNVITGISEEREMKGAGFAPGDLTLTYLLAKRTIPFDVQPELDSHPDKEADWILDNYDYERSDRLLFLLRESSVKSGPVVISTQQPVFLYSASKKADAPQHLLQDLSNTPVSLIPIWLTRFRNQSFQERLRQPTTLDSLAFTLRKYLEIAGLGLPTVQASVKVVSGK
jgi:hypothetical protein